MTNKLSDYDYVLPEGLIAQQPLFERSSSRLMLVDHLNQSIAHQQFNDINQYLRPNDLLILNNTKVIPARLYGRKETGGSIECLVERVLSGNRVLAQIKSSKSPKVNATLFFADDQLVATMIARHGEFFELLFDCPDVLKALEAFGELPLPPYISRAASHEDRNRYQTVYAEVAGAVAAPTAGLHFDDMLLDRIRQSGVDVRSITLHVGAGTFQPVRCEDLTHHKMHSEWINVDEHVVQAVQNCQSRGGRVIAVGTTVLRALESAAQTGALKAFQGDTDIFIKPGYQFQCVDALITNFHLPKSTLLMLVSALAGYDLIRQAYAEAIANQYRFFSYGDAMFIF